MNILLHGAINGSNFGDCIFADVFYHNLIQDLPETNIYFFDFPYFGMGEFLKNKLAYEKKIRLKDYFKMDKLIYISGGYFGEDIKSLKSSIIRFIRYFLVGLFMIGRGKEIYVVGVEVGPLYYGFIQKCVKFILKKSTLVVVRNIESQEYCEQLGVENVLCTADTALTLSKNTIEKKYNFDLKNYIDDKKKTLFIHVNPHEKINDVFKKIILDPVIQFVKLHKEYKVLFGCDGYAKDLDYESIVQYFSDKNIQVNYFQYKDYWELCYLISQVDLIITRKLHVGIVGSLFNKSIISIPTHSYKTKRFYRQIGEEERCIPFIEMTYEKMCNQLEKYYDIPIAISPDIISKATENMKILIDCLIETHELA